MTKSPPLRSVRHRLALLAAFLPMLAPAASAATDIAPAITGAEWRMTLGQFTSVYIFHADFTWEESYKGSVKGGAWKQTGDDSFSIGGFSFQIQNNGAQLLRSDRKIWRRAPAAAPFAAAPNAPRLIPSAPSLQSPNYWCTWWSQSTVRSDKIMAATIAFDGDQGQPSQRDGLNEAILFGRDGAGGWAGDYAAARAELFLVLDDGWDIPYGVDSGKGVAPFGSCIPDATRWPSCAGAPAQRLKKLNDMAKARGWRGVGLWIAIQKQGETHAAGRATLAEFTDYWRERVLWCKEAGIEYWKVDWGVHSHEPEFRRALTELGRKLHPPLIIEHAVCVSPLNGLRADSKTGAVSGSGRFEGNSRERLAELDALLPFAAVIRTYDVIGPVARVTTLDRAAHYLKTAARLGSGAVLSLEDSLYESAGLGCAFGAMRANKDRLSAEVAVVARWARVAPAVPAGRLPLAVSEEILRDDSDFTGMTHWYKVASGKKIHQSAPAVIARGLPLPKVTPMTPGGAVPFVTATLNPNGALAVCATPRAPSTHKGDRVTPPAAVSVDVDCLRRKIGLFGAFGSVSFPLSAAGKIRVWGQGILADRAVDITAAVTVSNNTLTLDGETLRRLCARASARELSAPAAVIFAEPAPGGE
jgi:hypothetical protein